MPRAAVTCSCPQLLSAVVMNQNATATTVRTAAALSAGSVGCMRLTHAARAADPVHDDGPGARYDRQRVRQGESGELG